jgi:hypothetical protein
VESDVSKAEENGFFSVFENQTNEATADAALGHAPRAR